MDGAFEPQAASEIEPEREAALGMVGTSAGIERVRRTVRRYAPLPAPVLVTGETGTGKELVARGLHAESDRACGPFVAVNAAAIPATLIASELFGHVRGAFTGATNGHRGLFQQAHGGTLFIDEVGELALDLQAWLLRVLETGEVRPLGAERSHKVDVRLIAATHIDLAAAVDAGRFRSDLYWRLAVLQVEVPPLRRRKDDIAPLAAHLLENLALPERCSLSGEALQALMLHDWPGNVRELRAVLLRAAALSSRTRLAAEDVVRAIGRGLHRPSITGDSDPIRAALIATQGNVSAAARLLGVPRSTFRGRIKSPSSALSLN